MCWGCECSVSVDAHRAQQPLGCLPEGDQPHQSGLSRRRAKGRRELHRPCGENVETTRQTEGVRQNLLKINRVYRVVNHAELLYRSPGSKNGLKISIICRLYELAD